jgi:hypothetical protein
LDSSDQVGLNISLRSIFKPSYAPHYININVSAHSLLTMRLLFIITILTATSSLIQGQEIAEKNNPKKHPTLTNKTFVDKIDGRSIEFYLNHKGIDSPAKLFYKGKYSLYDDEETFSFLDSILTKNSETRPFYLFIYNQAMKVTDGALSEYMASVCKRYFETYPCEFIAHLNDKISKTDLEKWTAFIGFEIYDGKAFESFAVDVDKKVNSSCPTKMPDWDKVKLKIEDKLEEK